MTVPPLHGGVVVTLVGARMHYAVPAALAELDLLHTFFTDTYVAPGTGLHAALTVAAKLPYLSKSTLVRSAFARCQASIPTDQVRSFDLWGTGAILLRNCLASQSDRDRLNILIGKTFCRKVVDAIRWDGVRCIYAYKSGALELFEAARRRGIPCLLEQTIAPKRVEMELLRHEFENWPDWQKASDLGSVTMAEREEREWELATAIVCASKFTKDALSDCGAEEAKCHVVPYAVDRGAFLPRVRAYDGRRPLRILFAGEVGLRKGIQHLFGALRLLDRRSFECRLAGPVALLPAAAAKIASVATLLGRTPKKEMPALFDWADVFVLPTLCEGSATVTYEAIASGLPVITTANCGSVIRSGLDGYLVAVRDPIGLATALNAFLDAPELLTMMSGSAFAYSKEFTWQKYGQRLSELMSTLVGATP